MAISSYKKADFVESDFNPQKYYKREFVTKYGPGDCKEGDMFMKLKISEIIY